jgi:hypothetical protein
MPEFAAGTPGVCSSLSVHSTSFLVNVPAHSSGAALEGRKHGRASWDVGCSS